MIRQLKALRLSGKRADLDSPSWLAVTVVGDRLWVSVVGHDGGRGLYDVVLGELSAEESARLDRALARAIRRSVKPGLERQGDSPSADQSGSER